MPIRKHYAIFTILLVIVVCTSLLRVHVAHADGETPTEPPVASPAPTQAATEPPTQPPVPDQAATQPPVESTATPAPVETTPDPAEATATPLTEALTQVPDSTDVVVLDANGNSVPLATQEATQIAAGTDPMWCPVGVLPGGPGCSAGYSTISALINNMVSNTASYTQNGVIYFTANPGTGTFNLSSTTLTSDFDTLKSYSLTLQGGWNGNATSPAFSGQTDFSNHPITIGSSSNPWVGNVTLNDLTFTGASQTSLTVYTTTGNITLNNVDVNNQAGGHNTALLNTNSGNVTVSDGTFDGNNTNSTGFSATTNSGAITINNSSFTENKKSGAANNSNGATLSASTVTLTHVTATGNDGNGIVINNANTVTLNNVVASNNGTNPPGPANNIGSGIFVNGNAGSNLFINGGTFDNNKLYGIELAHPANTTVHIQSAPASCTGNASGCSNGAFVSDTIPPALILPANMTVSATSSAGAVVTYFASATDNVDSTVAVTCSPASGSTFAIGTTTVSCFATDTAGNTALGSFQVTVVDTAVTPTPPSPTPSPTPSPSPSSTPSPTPSSAPQATGSDSSNSQSKPLPLIIPVTGGKMIDLGCNSAFWAFGIKLSFMSLCNYQTTLDNLETSNLPGALPDSYSFVMGLNLHLLHENQIIEELPNGASIQLDFPILDGSSDQFAVLSWNGNSWVEVPQQSNSGQGFYQVLTTSETGSFVLVKK